MGEVDDRLRIALVLGTSAGGVGRHVLTLVRGLVRRGHTVVVGGPPSVAETFGFTTAGAAFTSVPIADRPHPTSDARAVRSLRELAEGVDVVHAHGLRAGALAALALGRRRAASPSEAAARESGTAAGLSPERRTGPPLVVTVHNAPPVGGLVGAVYRVLERVVARRADRVLVVSPDLGERMAARGARHVDAAVVPAPPLAPAARTPEEVREELGVGDRPVLLTVARLAPQKGLPTLLDAVAAFGPQARAASRARPVGTGRPLFVIAGDGPLRDELRARIDRDGLPVLLLGARDDIADLLGAADAVVVPSLWEGQPLGVQEALRAGRPVVATAVGGIPAMVGDAGLLVPYGDVEALREAIRRVLTEPGLAARLAGAAAARGAALPGEEEAIEAVLAVYR
jgi:glycosyltransferase involved in cell wall biosynthesis